MLHFIRAPALVQSLWLSSQAAVAAVMGFSRFTAGNEQALIFQLVFGWPERMCLATGALEVAVAMTLVASSYGYAAMLCLVGGAIYIHIFRQKEPLAAVPALVLGLLAIGGAWTASAPSWEVLVAGFLLGAAGAAGVSRIWGHQPNTEAFARIMAATHATAHQIDGPDRKTRARHTATLPKGAKSL
jgi:hypothetical protein